MIEKDIIEGLMGKVEETEFIDRKHNLLQAGW